MMMKAPVAAIFAFASLLFDGSQSIVAASADQQPLRSLQDTDVDTIVIGDDQATVTVTIDQTAANGLVTYGGALVALTPLVNGQDTVVSCTATLNANLVDMRFYMRKALYPNQDSNGESQDYDCAAEGDTDLIATDTESCSVTNFNPVAEAVLAYVVVIDTGLNLGSTYSINLVCDRIDPPGSGSRPGCFSEEEMVHVVANDGNKAVTKTMKELAIGDRILVGGNIYEPVYGFAHRDTTKTEVFYDIYTTTDRPLGITQDHLVRVNGKYVPAREIRVGDFLYNGQGVKVKVTKIQKTVKQGLYAPLTPSGTLLVNGVKTSSYVSLQEKGGNVMLLDGTMDTGLSYHWINHIALSPIRMACMGISAAFCDIDRINDGYPSFVSFWFQLIHVFEEASAWMQVLLLGAALCVVGPLYLMESIFGAAAVPSVVVVLGATIIKNAATKKKEHATTDTNVKTV